MSAGAAMRLLLADLAATRRFAGALARALQPGDLVALSGELGVGKSELVRAVVRSLAGAPLEVPSPTFTLVQRYELPGLVLTHADLYRIRDPLELEELGLEEALLEGALLVEWPERAGSWLPAERLDLTLAFAPEKGEQARWLSLQGGVGWGERIARLVDEAHL